MEKVSTTTPTPILVTIPPTKPTTTPTILTIIPPTTTATMPPLPPTPPTIFTALIIGAGPAGLSAALTFARGAHPALVFDSSTPRNAGVSHMHTVASRDHIAPAEFRAISRRQIEERYSCIAFSGATIVKAARKMLGGGRGRGDGHGDGTGEKEGQSEYEGFEVTDDKGTTYLGRKIILATGSRDVLPPIEGYAQNWPQHIYQCLACDGFEQRGVPNGVLDVGPHTAHMVGMAMRFDSRVTVLTNGPVPDDAAIRTQLRICEAWGATLETRRIKKLINNGPTHVEGVTVEFEEGETLTLGFIANRPPTVNRAQDLIEQLGLECVGQEMGGYVKIVNPMFNSTSVRGVFAAGDTMTPIKQVAIAMADGLRAGEGAAIEVAAEKEEATMKELGI